MHDGDRAKHLIGSPVVKVFVLRDASLAGCLEEGLVKRVVVARVLHSHQPLISMHAILKSCVRQLLIVTFLATEACGRGSKAAKIPASHSLLSCLVASCLLVMSTQICE